MSACVNHHGVESSKLSDFIVLQSAVLSGIMAIIKTVESDGNGYT
jgi:hypothetical protein